jgi:hypothetical protein
MILNYTQLPALTALKTCLKSQQLEVPVTKVTAGSLIITVPEPPVPPGERPPASPD